MNSRYDGGKRFFFLTMTALNLSHGQQQRFMFSKMRTWVEDGKFEKVFYYLREFSFEQANFGVYLNEFKLTENSSWILKVLFGRDQLLKYKKLTVKQPENLLEE
jgi:hypothetical protein